MGYGYGIWLVYDEDIFETNTLVILRLDVSWNV
jgi:hypothetical protein